MRIGPLDIDLEIVQTVERRLRAEIDEKDARITMLQIRLADVQHGERAPPPRV